jgi:hypothetical protein
MARSGEQTSTFTSFVNWAFINKLILNSCYIVLSNEVNNRHLYMQHFSRLLFQTSLLCIPSSPLDVKTLDVAPILWLEATLGFDLFHLLGLEHLESKSDFINRHFRLASKVLSDSSEQGVRKKEST